MDVKETWEALQQGKLSAEQHIKEKIQAIEKNNRALNVFLYVNKDAVKEAKALDAKKKKGKLFGLAIAVKANINVTGMPASCASKTLEEYKATYDADVIKKIKQEDGVIVGITNCDEFACGSSGETSAFGPTRNPKSPERIPGGSSSGSAAAVAAEMADLALGSDTGGSIRNPASHCGVVGIKPTYGLVSRYGLIDLSMSLDQIGPFSSDVFGAALLLGVIAGESENDPTTQRETISAYDQKLEKPKKLTIGVSKDFEKLCTDKRIYQLIQKKILEKAKQEKYDIKEVALEHTDVAIQAYYPLVYTEFYSATRKFDGRRYGKKIEESCGEEVLRRIAGGKIITQAEFKGAYYRKALDAKKAISADFANAFKKADVIITPAVPKLPHKIGENISIMEMYAYDALTIPANLAGICAGVVPLGTIDEIPVGMQVMANKGEEQLLFQVLQLFEQ